MNEACRRYLEKCPNDPLDDLSEEDKDEFEFPVDPVSLTLISLDSAALLLETELASSKSDARRLISAGAVYCDGDKVSVVRERLPFRAAERINIVVKVGRKMKRIFFT